MCEDINNKNSNSHLWSNQDRSHFFLIPTNCDLLPGDYILRRGINHQISVDPIAIQPYEITREQAKDWLDSQFDEVLDEAKKATVELFGEETPSPTLDKETSEKLADGIEALAKMIAQRLRSS